MNIGEMRNRISFEIETTTTNLRGFPETSWTVFRSVWAKVNNLFGRDFYAAKAVQQENTVVFEIRYNKDIESLNTKITRINFKGRHFNIIHIDNVLYKNTTLKIKAMEIV